jgi:hypothetical protein
MNIVCHFLLTHLPRRTGSLPTQPYLQHWKEAERCLHVIHSYNVNPTGTSRVSV